MTIQENFDEVSTIITDSGLIELWGGQCVNKLDKDVPYGLKVLTVASSKESNIYSINENVKVCAYSYIRSLVSHPSITGAFKVEIGINIFVNPKKIGRVNAIYEIPMALVGKLKRKYKEVKVLEIKSERFSFSEMTTLTIPFLAYSSCEDLANLDQIC